MSRLSVLCIYNNGAGFHGDEGDSSAVCEPLNLLFLGAAVCRERGSELASTFITWGPLIRALLQSQISAIVTVCWWVWRDWNWLPWRPVTTSTNLNTYFCFLLGRSLSGAPPVVGTETEGRAIYMIYCLLCSQLSLCRMRGGPLRLAYSAQFICAFLRWPSLFLNTSHEISRNVSVE